MDYKQCLICKKVKPLDQFTRHKGSKLGRTNQCKHCTNLYQRIRYQKRKEGIKNG